MEWKIKKDMKRPSKHGKRPAFVKCKNNPNNEKCNDKTMTVIITYEDPFWDCIQWWRAKVKFPGYNSFDK